MHGRDGEDRIRSRHMWSAVAGDSSATSTVDSFSKDGRIIRVGDCALFKPSQDSPPFIGIIRCLSLGQENNLKLSVNWLYRPAEVKLGKRILLGAVPNEVFYSFHRDQIPAASLLHPCKVAFLPKGVDFPPGISSFVCRRVYDIANKSLCWLTDKVYINERQEEVDELLNKTRLEMHAAVKPSGRSPKPVSGSSSQIKSGTDSVQNSGTSFPSQVKGRKRERGDQGFESVKRERSLKVDDSDSIQFKTESFLKSEISKITERGGLVDTEGVEKLVQLMLPEKNERKIELGGRSLLSSVIAATDNFDCLSRFVQLKGLPVLDEWLQEAHKGKIGDSGSPRDNDKSVEEFLFCLLRALDKLPVNLNALQTCNIGKSVNHLRSHKNLEIQKKARSLVDTWKKRVEAEMKSHDAKSGSSQAVAWPASRPRHSDISYGGNKNMGGSSEAAMKSSVTQASALGNTSVKLVQGDIVKPASASFGPSKSVPLSASAGANNSKDGQPRTVVVGGPSDPPPTITREEKSSGSSQSCSSDHAKAGCFQGKEDVRNSTAGSISGNKMSGGTSWHRKTVNGFPGPTFSGVQRDSGSSRNSSLHRNPASEKLSQSGLTCEKTGDMSIVEGNSHKLIVKIPNQGRSPAHSASGGSLEDPSVMNSWASSPVVSEKHEQLDHLEKNDAYQANITSEVKTESWQSNDFKDILTGFDEGDGSPATLPNEEHCMPGDDDRKVAELPKAASSSSGNEPKSGKANMASFSSMNVLIESCVNYTEANEFVSVGDDVGMNLLASVAAGEMSKSDLASENYTGKTALAVESCTVNDLKQKPAGTDDCTRERSQPNDGEDRNTKKQCISSSSSWSKDGLQRLSKHALSNSAGDSKSAFFSEEKPVDHKAHIVLSCMDSQQPIDSCLENCAKADDTIFPATTGAATMIMGKAMETEEAQQNDDTKAVHTGVDAYKTSESKLMANSSEDKANILLSSRDGENAAERLIRFDCDKVNLYEGLKHVARTEQKPFVTMTHSESVEKNTEGGFSASVKNLSPENVGHRAEKAEEMGSEGHVSQTEKPKIEQETSTSATLKDQLVGSGDGNKKIECVDQSIESKEVLERRFGGSASQTELHGRSRESKLSVTEVEETEECASTAADASSYSAAGGSDVETKLEFDLNEGLNVDDGKHGEPINLVPPGCSASVNLISPLHFPISSVSSALPASITIAAAAKGPFVPPDDLLWSKGELGWKGSAATSAFRPAEPRKVMEMSLRAAGGPLSDAAAGKQGRRPLDIDLNVADDRMYEDMTCQNSDVETSLVVVGSNDPSQHDSAPVRSSGGLDLDLNKVDDAADLAQCSTSNGHRLLAPLMPIKSSSGGNHNGEVSFRGNFDLNNGPALDELNIDPSMFSQHSRSSISQPPVACGRMNNADVGNFSSWFSPGNAFSAVTIPSVLPDRGGQSFPIVATGGPARIMNPHTAGSPFAHDVYRGPVLSSSLGGQFSTPFQYPVFPFGNSFPLSSAAYSIGSTTYVDSSSGGRICFPTTVPPQFLGPAGAVSSQYPRPFVLSIPDSSNNAAMESSRKWGRQGLDLNAGPGVPDIEGRDESLPLATRQISVAGSQTPTEEQPRMYQVAGGALKRNDPEGRWDSERFAFKQSWQ